MSEKHLTARPLSILTALTVATLGRAALPAPTIAQEAPGPDYLSLISSYQDFATVAVASSSPLEAETAKFIVPASDSPELLPPLFQNAHRYPFHHEFLGSVFPDRFPGLTPGEYVGLTGRRVTRKYYAGTITRYFGAGDAGYGFTVFSDGSDPAELLQASEVRSVYERLSAVFTASTRHLPLMYAPRRSREILEAGTWEDPGFPIRRSGDQQLPDVITYTPAVGYGRVRLLTLDEFTEQDARGAIDWQTLVVLADVPSDIASVVAGVVTARPQGELGHLAIRLARRERPNLFVRDALEAFAPFEGKLVRLEATAGSYTVAEVPLQEAEAWWDANRPSVPPLPAVDRSHGELEDLRSMVLESPQASALQRFGAKAANLAILYRYLAPQYQTRGFGIPFRYYLEFMQENTIPSLSNPAMQVSFLDYIDEILADERFRSDGEFRRQVLLHFQEWIRDAGVIDPTLREQTRNRIVEVFEDPGVKVRFRSSSNAEDSLEFNGAGLYDSTSVCMADEFDGDASGPSACDPSKKKERTVARGLKKVWASLWSPKAFEEREYFQIDHREAAMAVLVTLAFPAEEANGVLFTGNPSSSGDDNYVVNVQLGDESVVQPGVGIEAEKDILAMLDGRVGRRVLVRPSSLAVPGQEVLSDAQLEELGNVVSEVKDLFLSHFDLGEHDPANVLLDFEFKFDEGRLVLKQARPFLRAALPSTAPTYTIRVPSAHTLCGLWEEYRHPDDEWRLKSQARLPASEIVLPASAGYVAWNLFESIVVGPQRRVAQPVHSGLFTGRPLPGVCREGMVCYQWTYDQEFDLDGTRLQLRTSFEFLGPREDEPFELTIDERYVSERLQMFGLLGEDSDEADVIRYSSCTYEQLPLWEISVEFEGGDRARFLERYLIPFAGSGPANVVHGEAELDGVRHEERSYWQLVYAADHHNWNEEFRLVFEPPITARGVSGVAALHVQEGHDNIPQGAALLDEDFRVVQELEVVSYEKKQLTDPPPRFRRGDPNVDSATDVADALAILLHLFAGNSLQCERSADINDDGLLEISDTLRLLSYLFLGAESPPEPFRDCGFALDDNGLTCASYSPCP